MGGIGSGLPPLSSTLLSLDAGSTGCIGKGQSRERGETGSWIKGKSECSGGGLGMPLGRVVTGLLVTFPFSFRCGGRRH